ncbi:GatB/YqeY domain-containing protein [Alicyclobacillaceae bacterium I2511]|nr:GatB/YqeY domain-containing protein [Alicyclobacillaceae bacterium I2511]
MVLSEQLSADMKQAMKDKDKVRLSVIRMVRSAMKYQEIALGHGLSDAEIVTVIQKELKQRRDSLQAFESASRADLVPQVQAEIEVLTGYLPTQLTEEQLRQLAAQVILEVGATGKSEIGKVMVVLMQRVRGQVDGKLAQLVVQSLLN